MDILIDNRYRIMLDTGVIYDTLNGEDIPQEIFQIRDRIKIYYE